MHSASEMKHDHAQRHRIRIKLDFTRKRENSKYSCSSREDNQLVDEINSQYYIIEV